MVSNVILQHPESSTKRQLQKGRMSGARTSQKGGPEAKNDSQRIKAKSSRKRSRYRSLRTKGGEARRVVSRRGKVGR